MTEARGFAMRTVTSRATEVMSGVVVALALAMPSGAVAAPGGNGSVQLKVSVDTGTQLRASFETSATTAAIEAHKAGPTRDVVAVTVGATTFTADRDLATGKASWGADGAGVTARDRVVMSQLLSATDTWRQGGVDRSTGATKQAGGLKDLTTRLLMLAAEAPEGVAIGTQVVDRPSERRLEKTLADVQVVADASATKADSCAADVVATTTADSAERVAALAACQQANEDGILYFGSCATTTRWLMHDAGSHCMVGESINAGPRSSECMGECGPGCAGLNIYTYDCGDHDRCGRVHGGSTNPWDSECGDEYFEADDDFIWGWPNCT